MKSAPIVARYPPENRPETYCVGRVMSNTPSELQIAHLAPEACLSHTRVSDDNELDRAHVAVFCQTEVIVWVGT